MGGEKINAAGMNAAPYGKYIPSNCSHAINSPLGKITGDAVSNHG
jgi:hypothetical protein